MICCNILSATEGKVLGKELSAEIDYEMNENLQVKKVESFQIVSPEKSKFLKENDWSFEDVPNSMNLLFQKTLPCGMQ